MTPETVPLQRIQLLIDPEQYDRVREAAWRQRMSANEYMRKAIANKLARDERKDKSK